jgi:hypothetical protein
VYPEQLTPGISGRAATRLFRKPFAKLLLGLFLSDSALPVSGL